MSPVTRDNFALCSYQRRDSCNFAFRHALFLEFRSRTRPQDLRPFLILETGLKFLIRTQGEIGLGDRASHVKRLLLTLFMCVSKTSANFQPKMETNSLDCHFVFLLFVMGFKTRLFLDIVLLFERDFEIFRTYTNKVKCL